MKIVFRVLLLIFIALIVLSPNLLVQTFNSYPAQYVILSLIFFGLGMLFAVVWLILARIKKK